MYFRTPTNKINDQKIIPKPSGGDPKNVETLRELQKRKSSDEGSKLESNKIK